LPARAEGEWVMLIARKLLIVDDDPGVRGELAEYFLLYDEFKTVTVETGSEGVRAAKADVKPQRRPDLLP
jgi:DNA-binding response OmpR family regulator